MRHLFCVENIDRCGSNLPKMCNFEPKNWIFGAKGQFFVLELRFLSTGHIASIPGARVAEVGSISAREKMTIKTFIKRMFAISVTNALFLP